jgi:hypothetical protein
MAVYNVLFVYNLRVKLRVKTRLKSVCGLCDWEPLL